MEAEIDLICPLPTRLVTSTGLAGVLETVSCGILKALSLDRKPDVGRRVALMWGPTSRMIRVDSTSVYTEGPQTQKSPVWTSPRAALSCFRVKLVSQQIEALVLGYNTWACKPNPKP